MAKATTQMSRDWARRFGYRPTLLETFAHRDRHRGTCYQAAAWLRLGETTGRGKWSHTTLPPELVEVVFVRPLVHEPRRYLRAREPAAPQRHGGRRGARTPQLMLPIAVSCQDDTRQSGATPWRSGGDRETVRARTRHRAFRSIGHSTGADRFSSPAATRATARRLPPLACPLNCYRHSF
ncbi:MAG: DUF4338 domain-containing protein [Candidatus Schekmanbacteria bacterium]|nr:DUF4338 domain-containing protein [Candidatus Schekmanbacteria bacterium]